MNCTNTAKPVIPMDDHAVAGPAYARYYANYAVHEEAHKICAAALRHVMDAGVEQIGRFPHGKWLPCRLVRR